MDQDTQSYFLVNISKNLLCWKKRQEAKALLKNQENTKALKFEGNVATLDLDTPEDWKTWRKGRAN